METTNGNGKASKRNGTKTTVAVGYLRRSTDRQEQSIPDQRKAVEQYAAENGLRLERLFLDDAISGTSATGRRAFQEMIAEAQRPERPFSYVIVYDVKRFGRVDNDEAGYYRHILKTHGVEVIYVSENFSGDGTDDLLRPVKQWQAREESKDLSKVTIRGLLSKVSGGWWMGGAPPFRVERLNAVGSGGWMEMLNNAVAPVTLPSEAESAFYRIAGH
jgi:DNA invertase Pin-like site-specific DNA recombinase